MKRGPPRALLRKGESPIQRIGRYTLEFDRPRIECTGSVVGEKEACGPLGARFDVRNADERFGQKTFEQAEAFMQQTALQTALDKQSLAADTLDFVLGGDLENQCIASSFGLLAFNTPFLGLYGACSTMAESLALAALLVDAGAAGRAAAVTSSHFCTAERQFRTPLEYGGQRPPTAQWTVTGAGASVVCDAALCKNPRAPFVRAATFGRITQLGVKDINNMGAAMAPAAAETAAIHLRDRGLSPGDFDRIVTGDLGQLGLDLTRQLLAADGIDITPQSDDCGCLVYENSSLKFGCGGSGCGCSAAVFNSLIYQKLVAGEYKNVLFIGTGALMSPLSVFQGEIIPTVAHAVHVCTGG